eukprot:CAMPEP_0176118706 /NCGR_PEP_ID=MMETSP0120_2-20121206/59665_1 /TAXON_ID=160619 /ORGANISM="Kryptoperidinium foliaceum, Strain CCMP 1326" /LENGTH=80 /DNA_ID=CAMNT_0017453063 /DNA_START=62 /DNA_END=300 /DNA_ORIENTATION=+
MTGALSPRSMGGSMAFGFNAPGRVAGAASPGAPVYGRMPATTIVQGMLGALGGVHPGAAGAAPMYFAGRGDNGVSQVSAP